MAETLKIQQNVKLTARLTKTWRKKRNYSHGKHHNQKKRKKLKQNKLKYHPKIAKFNGNKHKRIKTVFKQEIHSVNCIPVKSEKGSSSSQTEAKIK